MVDYFICINCPTTVVGTKMITELKTKFFKNLTRKPYLYIPVCSTGYTNDPVKKNTDQCYQTIATDRCDQDTFNEGMNLPWN